MGLLLYIYISFMVLVFLGVMLIDLLPYTRRREAAAQNKSYRPNVLVIVPCRGIDMTLGENLKSIASQDYPRYKVVAVVDSISDSSVKYIKQAGISCIASDYKRGRASGKVRAIVTALRKFRNYGAYVIADSDILVSRSWLRELVSPLAESKTGVSTTFPRFEPKRGFWSKVKFVWGFVGQGMMESKATRFGWGGSMAFRKDLITKDTMDLLENSRYSVSDDICLTKAAKSMGMSIAYVESAQPVVNSDDTFPRFFEWANRQTALSLLGYGKNLYYGIAFYAAEILLFISGIVLAYFVSPLFILFLAHFMKSEMVTYRRARTPGDIWIAIIVVIMPIIYLVNLLLALRTTQITWRGRKYSVK